MMYDVLIDRLKEDYPSFHFQPSQTALWSSTDSTIYYDNNIFNTLHELGHAILEHSNFNQDIELIRMESDAWEQARQIAKNYDLDIQDEMIESAMDNYRDWLHNRSLCPKCSQNGIQSARDLNYYCVNCDTRWKVNDARSCGLKRSTIKQKTAPDS